MPEKLSTSASRTAADTPAGYAHPAYAAALSDIGVPRALPQSGGTLVVREIGATGHRDAMGPYPIFSCTNWAGLEADLGALGDDLVAVSLVADPFGDWSEDMLQRCFPDVLLRFKDHFVAALGDDPLAHVESHHRRNIARARREVEVDVLNDPTAFIDAWEGLYGALIARHEIRGVAAFSRSSLAAQLAVPGMVVLRATSQGATIGAALWYVQGDVAYYHLAAYTEAGYARRASFALFAAAFELFAARGLSWASLGAGAGASADGEDGLSRFKRGWATDTRPAWFGGRVLHRDIYDELSGARGAGWFPAYRQGEFT